MNCYLCIPTCPWQLLDPQLYNDGGTLYHPFPTNTMILFNTENELKLEVCTVLDTTATILFPNRPLFKSGYYSRDVFIRN